MTKTQGPHFFNHCRAHWRWHNEIEVWVEAMQYRPSIEDIGRGIYIQQCLHLSHTSDFTKCWEWPCSRRVSKKCVYLLITIILTPLLTSTTFEMVASLLHQDTTEYNVMYPCNYQLHCLTISQYLILIVVAIYTVVPQHKRKLGRFWQLGKPSMSFPLWTIRHLPSSSAAVLLVAKYYNTQCN